MSTLTAVRPRYTVETFVGAKFGAWVRSERTWRSAEEATAAAQEIASAEKRDGLVIMKRRVVGV